MDPPKPFAYEGFGRTSEPASNSVGSLSHTDMIRTTNDPNNNNNSLGSRSRSSTSFKDFMRNNDPNNNNNNSSSTRSSYKSPGVAAAASLHNDNSNYMDLRSHYFRQQSGPAAEAAMFARASDSSGSGSDPSLSYHNSYKEHNTDRHHYQSNHAYISQHAQNSYLLQQKDPPGYDSRPNLKNDQSDSYKPYSETQEAASHQRDNTDTTSSNNLKPKQAQHLEASPRVPESTSQKPHGGTSNPKSAAPLAKSKPVPRTNADRSEPRPYPRAGRPPASTTVPVCPKLPSRKLGRRGLMLGQKPQQRAMSKRGHDPGPLQGLSTTITVECQGCGEIIKMVPKNAIALECPSCKKFYPTVTCRVLQ